MGGDLGVSPIVDGALQALRERPDTGLKIILVGDQKSIQGALHTFDTPPEGSIRIEHADEVVAMNAPATDGLRRKNTSIAVGLKLHKDGHAQGFISPGNTGAVMAGALMQLQRLKGVQRPAIASLFPSPKSPTIVLDVGANSECKPQHLVQFAVMGSSYSKLVLGHTNPRVGLLSIGSESSKGTEITQATNRLLAKERELNFIGNVEGRDVVSGDVDVVVTDGFVGNILLKFAEGIGLLLQSKLKHQISTNVFSRFGATLMSPFLRRLKNSLDADEFGGAPLLGVDGVIVICHGSAPAKAIKNAVFKAEESAREGVKEHIMDHFSRSQSEETTNAA
jgi:glycerol-3-phosphate acyltransferase PlsX